MNDLIIEWRGAIAPTLKPSTLTQYAWAFGKLRPVFGVKRLDEITRSDIQRFLTRMGAELSPESIRDLRARLRALLGYGVEWEWLTTNPAAGRIRLPERVHVRPKRVLTPQEFARLIEALPEPYATAVIVAALCGLRAGELAALRW